MIYKIDITIENYPSKYSMSHQTIFIHNFYSTTQITIIQTICRFAKNITLLIIAFAYYWHFVCIQTIASHYYIQYHSIGHTMSPDRRPNSDSNLNTTRHSAHCCC